MNAGASDGGSPATARPAFALACLLEGQGRIDEAVRAFEALAGKLRDASDPEERRLAAWSLMRAALAQKSRGDLESALRCFETIVRRYAGSREPALRETTADALLRTALLLMDLEEFERALLSLDDLARRFAPGASPALILFVAQARFHRVEALRRVRRLEEAVVAAREFLDAYAGSPQPAVRLARARLPATLVLCLGPLRRFDEVRVLSAEAIRDQAEAQDPGIRRALAETLLNAAEVFREEEILGDQLTLYDEYLRLFDVAPEASPGLLATVLLNRGACLAGLERPEEELAAYEEVIGRFRDCEEPDAQRAVVLALANRGLRLLERGEPQEAVATLRRAWALRDLLPGRGRRVTDTLRAHGIFPETHGFV